MKPVTTICTRCNATSIQCKKCKGEGHVTRMRKYTPAEALEVNRERAKIYARKVRADKKAAKEFTINRTPKDDSLRNESSFDRPIIIFEGEESSSSDED